MRERGEEARQHGRIRPLRRHRAVRQARECLAERAVRHHGAGDRAVVVHGGADASPRAAPRGRARGQFRRPFTKVEDMRKEAETKYIAREKELQDEIQRTELQIGELQRERTSDGMQQIVLTPEQAARIGELQKSMVASRKELRQVQHDLRRDVESLGTRLLVLDAIVWPLAVAAVALAWDMVRGRTSRREAST